MFPVLPRSRPAIALQTSRGTLPRTWQTRSSFSRRWCRRNNLSKYGAHRGVIAVNAGLHCRKVVCPFCACMGNLICILKSTRRTSLERIGLQESHERFDPSGGRKWKSVLLHVDRSIPAGPVVDANQPALMHLADVLSKKSMVSIYFVN